MTKQQAAEITATLAAVYDIPAWSKERLKAFALSIVDLPFEAALGAAHAWIRTHSERPQPANLIAATRKQLEAAGEIPADPDFDQAWGAVRKQIHAIGRYGKFPDDDPAIKAAVDRIGWEEICNSPEDGLGILRAQFERFYRAELSRRHEARHSSPGLRQPDDQVRLERRQSPTLAKREVLQLPSPQERASIADSLHSLADQIAKKPLPRPVTKTESPLPEMRVPTVEEENAAAERRQKLRDQLRIVEGGKVGAA